MTDLTENKRFNDRQLDAIADGVLLPTIEPSMLAAPMQSTVDLAITGGGADTYGERAIAA